MGDLLFVSRIFNYKFDRLKELLFNSEEPLRVLDMSAILRHMVLDGGSLAQDMANRLGLPVRLPRFAAVQTEEGTFKDRNYGNIDDFLSHTVGKYSYRQIIDAFANAAGGVHHKTDGGDPKMQREIVDHLFIKDPQLGEKIVCEISSLLLTGLLELREANDYLNFGLRQTIHKRQPLIYAADHQMKIVYSGSQYLEGFHFMNFETGFSIAFPFAVPKSFESVQCFFAIGNRKDGNHISFWRLGQNKYAVNMVINGKKIAEVSMSCLRRDVIYISVSKSDFTYEIEIKTRSGFSKREGLSLNTSMIAGKIIVGADIEGKNCGRFANNEFFLYEKTLFSKDIEDLFENCASFIPIYRNINTEPTGYISMIYNQGNDIERTEKMHAVRKIMTINYSQNVEI